MNVILSHPTGNANVRAAAAGLFKAGLLKKFYTTIAAYPGDFLYKLGGIGPLAEIRRRTYDASLQTVTEKWPWKEAGRLFASKSGISSLTRHETGMFSVDAVYKDLDRHVAASIKGLISKNSLDAVYCYEDGAMETFATAKKNKLSCLYDLPIGYWRASEEILKAECERWPEWIATMSGLKNSRTKLERKDAELELADEIFVASSFTASTLQKFPGKLSPIHILPYGFPPVTVDRRYNRQPNSPVKILFVGGLSQRKGIADLFSSVQKFTGHVKLTVVGRKPKIECPALEKELSKHTWIASLPHSDILSLMRENDVLVFPSMFEGFGLVVTEAMSQGTPVITTERTCGPDLITNGKNGWLIKAGDANQLDAAIENLVANPELIAEVGHEAGMTASRRPWQLYGSELAGLIQCRK